MTDPFGDEGFRLHDLSLLYSAFEQFADLATLSPLAEFLHETSPLTVWTVRRSVGQLRHRRSRSILQKILLAAIRRLLRTSEVFPDAL